MSEYTTEEIHHHVKTYVMVFVALATLTIVTVAIYVLGGPEYLDLGLVPSVILALIVASIKGTLVACYFMHLISEKVTIYWTLLVTLAFFLVLMFVPLSTMLAQAKV